MNFENRVRKIAEEVVASESERVRKMFLDSGDKPTADVTMLLECCQHVKDSVDITNHLVSNEMVSTESSIRYLLFLISEIHDTIVKPVPDSDQASDPDAIPALNEIRDMLEDALQRADEADNDEDRSLWDRFTTWLQNYLRDVVQNLTLGVDLFNKELETGVTITKGIYWVIRTIAEMKKAFDRLVDGMMNAATGGKAANSITEGGVPQEMLECCNEVKQLIENLQTTIDNNKLDENNRLNDIEDAILDAKSSITDAKSDVISAIDDAQSDISDVKSDVIDIRGLLQQLNTCVGSVV